MLGNIELEGWAIKRVGDLWAAMAQFDVALSYLNRACQLAAEHGLVDLERSSRNNIAGYAIQIREPEVGLRVLVPLVTDAPSKWAMSRMLLNEAVMTAPVGDATRP